MSKILVDSKSATPLYEGTESDEAMEYLIAIYTGWTLEYIRSLSQRDYEIISLSILTQEKISRSKETAMMGIPRIL